MVRIMKRICNLLCLALIVVASKAYAYDFEAVCPSGQTLYYNIVDENTVELTSGSPKPAGNIVIPSSLTHNGITYSVISIGTKAFYQCEGVTGITIANTIKKIGSKAFEDCSITSIVIPLSVKIVEASAFFGNPITTVSILNPEIVLGHSVFWNTPWHSNQPNNTYIYIGTILCDYKGITPSVISINEGTTSIAGWIFSNMSDVVTISIPNSVRVIGDYAFEFSSLNSQSQMTSITIPSNLKWIGSHAFSGCGGFSTLTLPTTLEYIGDGAFQNCDDLISISYDAQRCKTGNYGMVFDECDNLETINVGNTVRSIPAGLFWGCNHVTNLTMANGVDTKSQEAFSGCSLITNVTIPESVDYIGKWAFSHCTNLNTINFNAKDCHTSADSENALPFQDCNAVSTINFGNNVHTIPSFIFYGTKITSITIPQSVTLIESKAFANSSLLTTLVFKAAYCRSNCALGGPFHGCRALANVTFGNNVHYIPDRLFYNTLTSSIGTLTLPSALTYIGRQAFGNCSGIFGTLSIPDGVTKINHSSFFGCTGLTDIIIPNTVNAIDTMAFDGCTGVRSVTIGTAVDTIRSDAFVALGQLGSIKWNAINCRSIDKRVFSGARIGSFVTGPGVQTIPDNLISNCPFLSLSSVTFSNSLYRIGAENFTMCASGALHLPASLTSIGYNSFNNCVGQISRIQCDAITPPYLEPNPLSGGTWSFGSYSVLYVPCESIQLYRSAQGWSNFDSVLGTGDCNCTVELIVNIPGMGTVSGGGTYVQGTSVTISAYPNSGYKFERWSDGDTQRQRTIVVNEDVRLIAFFALNDTPLNEYTVELIANNPEMGTVSGSGTYAQGTSVAILAYPYPGYRFERWSDGDTIPHRTIVVNEDIVLVAYFARIGNSVEDDFINDIQIYANNNSVVIQGAEGHSVVIYNIDGRLIAAIDKADYQVTRKMPSAGVYIVKIGTSIVRKIIIQ